MLLPTFCFLLRYHNKPMEEVRKNPALKLIQGSSTDAAAVQEACLDTEAVILGVATEPVGLFPVQF